MSATGRCPRQLATATAHLDQLMDDEMAKREDLVSLVNIVLLLLVTSRPDWAFCLNPGTPGAEA